MPRRKIGRCGPQDGDRRRDQENAQHLEHGDKAQREDPVADRQLPPQREGLGGDADLRVGEEAFGAPPHQWSVVDEGEGDQDVQVAWAIMAALPLFP